MKRIVILALFLIGCKESQTKSTLGPGVEIESFSNFISSIRVKPNWLLNGNYSGEADSIRNIYQHKLNYTLTSDEGDLPSDIEGSILDRLPDYFGNHLKQQATWTTVDPSRRVGVYTFNKREGRIDVTCSRISPKEIGILIDFVEK